MIHSIVAERMGYKLLFVESVCNDPKIIQATIKEVKVSSPDYKDVENDTVLNDFLLRIQHYEALYQPLDEILESHFSFMKIFNTGECASRFIIFFSPSGGAKTNIYCVSCRFLFEHQVPKCWFTVTRATSRVG